MGLTEESVNLAFALALESPRLRVGVLDLDIFGPSIPTLFGLTNACQPETTSCAPVTKSR